MLSVIELAGYSKILVPKTVWERIVKNLHKTHSSDHSMIPNTRKKIFWPNIRQDLKNYYYKSCKKCLVHRRTKNQAHNKVSFENLFQNCVPGQRVEADFMEFGSQDYMIMVDCISGFLKACKTTTKNKQQSTEMCKRMVSFTWCSIPAQSLQWSCLPGAF